MKRVLGKKLIASLSIMAMLSANVSTVTVQAGPLDGLGGWISDRAEDVSSIASDAGQAIADSDAGKFIGDKAAAAGEALGSGMSAAGEFIGENASAAADWVANSDAGQFVGEYAGIAGEWIGTNAAAAGKMIGENAAIAKVWIGENAEIAGSFIGENASTAVDWLGKNGSSACDWIVENGTIVGAWIGETASGAGVWIGENASAAGTMIGETASGAGIWINERVTDINAWIEENSLFSEDGIAVLGDNLAAFGIEKKEDLEDLATGVMNYVENIDPSVYTSKEYYIQTGEKLLLGEYSDADMTGLAVGLNVVASIVNLDMAMDLRDLAHDIQYIGDGSVGIVELGIDAASCLPVIGVVKNVKYLDDIKDVAKAVDGITDVADGVKDASKVADVIDGVKDASKAADVVDGVKDASKVADAVDEIKDASKVADAVDDVKDASKAADVADDVKDASKAADTADDVKEASKVADTADDVKDATNAADTADAVKDTSNAAEVASDVKKVGDSIDKALIPEYLEEVEKLSKREINSKQLEKFNEMVDAQDFVKLDPEKTALNRRLFNNSKNKLIAEWEKYTGEVWPRYEEDILNEAGKVIRNKGDLYDAHHLIEVSFGGPNSWWNLLPVSCLDHQAGIHGAGSLANQLF